MEENLCKKCGSEMEYVENRRVGNDVYRMFKCLKCNRLVAVSN